MKVNFIPLTLLLLLVVFSNSCVKENQIQPPQNIGSALIANAGSDQTILLPVNSLLLDGSGSNPLATNVNCLWTKISGPQSYTIVNANMLRTQVNDLTQGTYRFELKITRDGQSASDTMQVFVNASATISCDGRPRVTASLVPIGLLS